MLTGSNSGSLFLKEDKKKHVMYSIYYTRLIEDHEISFMILSRESQGETLESKRFSMIHWKSD